MLGTFLDSASLIALANARKNKTEITVILDKIEQNKQEIEKLKNKTGLCPQSLII